MKKNRILWASLLALAAVLLLLDAVGVNITLGIPLWRIALAIFLLFGAAEQLHSRSYTALPLLAALLFLLFARYILPGREISVFAVLAAAMLLCIAVSLLTAEKKEHRSDRHSKLGGDSVMYINSADINDYELTNRLGSMEVYFENADGYTGGSRLRVSNELGSIEIHVPWKWSVRSEVRSSMGTVDCAAPHPGAPELVICGSNSMGSVEIVYDQANS